jgi:CheY-like chemotaxis protein
MPVIDVDGALLPVVELREILGFPERHSSYDKDKERSLAFQDRSQRTVIIIQSEDHRIGFLVDDLVEEREIVIKHLGPCLKRVRNVAGATTFREDIIIILFVRDLIISAEAFFGEPLAKDMLLQGDLGDRIETKKASKCAPRILIVDDSLNTREVERTILENAGYQVETAVSGVEGLAKLQQAPFELVVTDIEMPEMDGWEFIRQIKRDEALHDIPVIIVSALKTEEDKKKSLSLGADAYIAKGEFDEQTLLQTVDICLNVEL